MVYFAIIPKMKYIVALWLFFTCTHNTIIAQDVRSSYFEETILTEQDQDLNFKKIDGRKSKLQWAALCSKHDACRSFYVDDGACVFGLSDDVTEFANGDDVTPADGQMLMTKRKTRIRKYH